MATVCHRMWLHSILRVHRTLLSDNVLSVQGASLAILQGPAFLTSAHSDPIFSYQEYCCRSVLTASLSYIPV